MKDVAALLAQSRAAHDAYRMALPRFDVRTKQVIPGDSAEAARCLQLAYDLRVQAEHLDRAEASPAWADQEATHPHYSLLKFYDGEGPVMKRLTVEPVAEVKPRG